MRWLASRADLLRDLGRDGGDGVVVLRRDAHHPRRLSAGAESDGEDSPEADRHLTEDVPGNALADQALDPVDVLRHLDAAVEHREQRLLAALLDGDIRPGQG